MPNNATESADYDYYFNSTQAAAELDTDTLSRKFFEANSPTLTGLDTGVKLIDQLLNANAFYLESTFGLGLLSIFTKNNLAIYNVYKLIHDRDQLQYVCGVAVPPSPSRQALNRLVRMYGCNGCTGTCLTWVEWRGRHGTTQ